jgi:maltooligosyltrehalose trehalohydrolase
LHTDGYGLDVQWCDEWHHALHGLLTGEKNGYYSDFGEIQHLTKSFNNAYVYDGVFSSHRNKKFGTSTKGQPGNKFIIFTQNHDQVGNRMEGERLSALVDFETLKLAAGSMLISPFIPMLFMGEEFAADTPFLYFISHEDENLVELVRKGRKEEFRYFVKDAEPPDPASPHTFNASKLKWDFHNDQRKNQMFEYYKKLISLRKQLPLLTPGNRDNTLALTSGDGNAITLIRKSDHENLYAFFNFSDKSITLNTPDLAGTKPELLIYSAHQQWGGHIESSIMPVEMIKDAAILSLQSKSFLLIQTKY